MILIAPDWRGRPSVAIVRHVAAWVRNSSKLRYLFPGDSGNPRQAGGDLKISERWGMPMKSDAKMV